MNQRRTATETEPPPFGMDYEIPEQKNAGSLVPSRSNQTSDVAVVDGVITAQRCAVERDMQRVMNTIKPLANQAGSRWYYRIPFKKKGGGLEWVEGISVKGTNSVARAYGNCIVDTRVVDQGDSWIIYARFVDIETGFSLTRPFQQRKGQDTGMKDAERRLDMVFQIGVSKAVRNVVSNALEDLCSFAFEEARVGVLDRVNKNPEKAKAWILSQLSELKIDVKRVELAYARTVSHWTSPDMAKMYGEINGLLDGMSIAAEVYPPIEAETKEADKTPKKPEQPAGDAAGSASKESETGQTEKPSTGNAQTGPSFDDAVLAVQAGDIDTARDIARKLPPKDQADIEQAIANRASTRADKEQATQTKPKNLFADD